MKNPYRLPDRPQKSDKDIQREVNYEEYRKAQAQLDEQLKQGGPKKEESHEGPISKAISTFFDRREAREMVKVNKKKDMLLCIFLGWAGAHRFYQKQKFLGFLYLATCWTGYSMAMSIVDFLIIFPKKPDEDGNILM